MSIERSKKEVREYYDHVYHPRTFSDRKPIRDYTARIRSLLSSFEDNAPLFLDVGCGTGRFVKAVQREGPTCIGVDVSIEALKHAVKVSPESIFLIADGERLPFKPGVFSSVVSNGSLEHFDSPAGGLTEISRTMRKGGLMLLSVPNSRFWPDILGLYHGTGQIQERPYSLSEWSGMISDNGFSIRSVEKDYGPPLFKNFNLFGILRRIFLKIACLAPLRYNYQFVFLTKKETG